MANIMEYVLNLSGNLEEKLKRIGINNSQQLNTWSKVQQQVQAADRTMSRMGRSMGSLQERIAALRAQREWIPASNRAAIRATNTEIKALESEIRKLESLNGGKLRQWWSDLRSSMPFQTLTNPIVAGTLALGKFNQYLKQSTELYAAQSTAETKLAAVMRNTMGASQDETRSILELTSAQQKLGVIGDEVQLAGAQEMATYLGESENLKKLIPALNDMLAQQYGLNASQEQAVTIGTMLGKVMQGQTGALSRYGYAFDKAQEKILKNGTEAERAAVLFDVVSEAVGGVNASLAATPEGKLKQIANNAGDLQERVGRLVVLARSAFSGVYEKLQEALGGTIAWFEENMTSIRTVISAAADGIATAFNIVFTVVSKLVEAVKFCAPAIYALAAAFATLKISVLAAQAPMAWFTVRYYAYTAATTVATLATKAFGAALKFIQAHPVIAAITALTAVTVFAVAAFRKFNAQQNAAEKLVNSTASKIMVEKDSMNQLFDALKRTEPCSERRKQLLQEISEKYPGLLNAQKLELAGEREIEAARRAANDELERGIFLQATKEQRETSARDLLKKQEELVNNLFNAGYSEQGIRLTVQAVRKATDEALASGAYINPETVANKLFGVAERNMANMVKHRNEMGNVKGWKDFIESLAEGQKKLSALERFGSALGITSTGINSALSTAAAGAGTGTGTGTGTGGAIAASSKAIATGGTRSTTVNIKIDKGIGDVYFTGTTKENQSEIERTLAEALYRVLGIVETTS